MKVLIIGLDGATWDVFDDFLLDHHMPNLKKLKCEGYSGVLQSTEPPITPAAWTTCLTGCQPYTHGVVGFQEYSFKENRLKISSSASCLVPNIWQELSKQGYRVASINVPWTYPCHEVNGILVAGYGCPGPQSQFTYPSNFKDELLKNIPDYDIRAHWDWKPGDTFAKFGKNIERVERNFQQRLETAKLIAGKINCDVMMVEFQDIDTMEHHIWSYLDKHTRDMYDAHRDRLFRMFEKLDKTIGYLLDVVSSKDSMVVVLSDHGLGKRIATISPNVLLHQWKYLKFRSVFRCNAARRIRHLRRRLHSLLFPTKQTAQFNVRLSDVDLRRSKAVVMHMALSGYVYINVKKRQLFGCVNPTNEYGKTIEDLRRRFQDAVDSNTGQPLFSKVAVPTELYNIEKADAEKFGDLLLIPQPGYTLSLSRPRSGQYVKMMSDDSIKGCHRYEGVIICYGANIGRAKNRIANIVDVAPTVYAALGAKLPGYMDGRVLVDVFSQEIKIQYQDSGARDGAVPGKKEQLSATEEALVAKRLAELGYLD